MLRIFLIENFSQPTFRLFEGEKNKMSHRGGFDCCVELMPKMYSMSQGF